MILGKHTLDETRDLLAVVDYRFREVEKAIIEALTSKVLTADNDIYKDWIILKDKWKIAREEIVSDLRKKALLSPISPPNIIATEDVWIKTISFVQYQELVKGSLQDIYNRLGKLTGHRIDFSKQPAQATQDVDLMLFKELDTDIKQMEAAASAAKKATGEALTSNTAFMVMGSIVGVGLAAVAVKSYFSK